MSDFVLATLDAILLLRKEQSNRVAQRLVDNAAYWLETDLRNYLTGRS